MIITSWLDYKTPLIQKNKFINSYLTIFNSPENLKYLSLTGELFTKEQVHSWVYGLIETSDIKYVFAEVEGNIVGIIVLKIITKSIIEIYGLGVDINYKRKGVASKLLIAVINSYSSTTIIAKVFEDNIPMISFLSKNGFIFIENSVEVRNDGVKLVKYAKRIQLS